MSDKDRTDTVAIAPRTQLYAVFRHSYVFLIN